MQRQLVRVSATTAVVLAIGAGGALLGAGLANAAPSALADTCSTTLLGQPGEPAELRQSAVVGPVTDVVKSIPLLGPSAAQTVANTMNSWAPLPLGSIPSTGSRTVPGSQIASQVVSEINNIPVLGLVLGLVDSGVTKSLTNLCTVTLSAIPLPPLPPLPPPLSQPSSRPASPPSQAAPPAQGGGPNQAPAPGPSPAGGPLVGAGAPGDPLGSAVPSVGDSTFGGYSGAGLSPSYDFGQYPSTFTAPSIDYTSLPGADVPGSGNTPGGSAADSPTNLAGQANALSTTGEQGISMPIALAVLALGGVTAGLVRSWVLRRSMST